MRKIKKISNFGIQNIFDWIEHFVSRSGALVALALLVLWLAGSGATGAESSPVARPAAPEATPAAVDGLDERTPVSVPEPSALALRFYRTGNWLWAIDELWTLAVLALLLFTGASAAIRNLAKRIGRNWVLTIAIYAVLWTGLLYLIDLPLAYYQGFVRQHAYGLSNQTLGRWFGNSLKAVLVAMAGGFLFTWVPYLLLARSPKRWWLYTTILAVPFMFFVMLIAPVWIDPLFNAYGPMKNRALESKILALATRAGIDGGRIYEVDKSRDTKAVNAYVKGFLSTKRIVLYDTLLQKLDDKEVLVVMGHEMGHYVLGHVTRTIWLSTIVILVSLFAADRLGRRLIARFSGRFGFDRLSDVASVPLLLILLQVMSLLLSPVALAYSRAQEHEADRFALELTRTNRSAALAFAKLQQENLSNPWPGPLYKLWRSTHPSIGERITYCNQYHPWTEGRPLVYAQWFRP
jgi:Zn-dependent protease with chaperone function